jgi:hypothetical protein
MAAAAALAIDPEKLLWQPSAKTIFIPKPQVISFADAFFSVSSEPITATGYMLYGTLANGNQLILGHGIDEGNGKWRFELPAADPTGVWAVVRELQK